MGLTRTLIERYTESVAELQNSADAWTHAANAIENAADEQVTSINNATWAGDARDTACSAAYGDRGIAFLMATHLRELSEDARNGASDLVYCYSRCHDAITVAENDGYLVTDELEVRDRSRCTLEQAAARYTRAQDHRDEILYHATTLETADTQLGETLAVKGASLQDYIPNRWTPRSGEPTIQAAGWKTGPNPDPNDPHSDLAPAPPPQMGPPPEKTIEDRVSDLEKDKAKRDGGGWKDPNFGDAAKAATTGCGGGVAGALVPSLATGPLAPGSLAGACVVGGALGLAGYLGEIWVNNVIENNK